MDAGGSTQDAGRQDGRMLDDGCWTQDIWRRTQDVGSRTQSIGHRTYKIKHLGYGNLMPLLHYLVNKAARRAKGARKLTTVEPTIMYRLAMLSSVKSKLHQADSSTIFPLQVRQFTLVKRAQGVADMKLINQIKMFILLVFLVND